MDRPLDLADVLIQAVEDLGWTYEFAVDHGHFNAKVLRFVRFRFRTNLYEDPVMRLSVVIPKWVENQFVVCISDFKIRELAQLFEAEMIDIRDPDSLQVLEFKVNDIHASYWRIPKP